MGRKLEFDKRAIPYILGLLVIIGLIFYWRVGSEKTPGDLNVKTGNYRLEDGQYEAAVKEFSEALRKNPDHAMARLGLAVTYMQMKKNTEAMAEFDRVIAQEPDLAVAYADRGILNDRLGNYQEALADYKKAIALDEEILKGPGWLWRFMRNIDEKPPTIKDRAAYLEAELAKPGEERVLRVPEADKKQRMYKIDD